MIKENLNNLMENIIRNRFDKDLKVEDFCKDWSATSNYKIVVPKGETGNDIVTLYMEYSKSLGYKIKASRPFENVEIAREFLIEDIENADKVEQVTDEISRFLFIENLLFLNEKSASNFKERLLDSMGEEFHILMNIKSYNEVENKLSIYFEYKLGDDEKYKTALICLTQRDCGDVYVETYTKNATRKESLRNKDILIDLIINDMSK